VIYQTKTVFDYISKHREDNLRSPLRGLEIWSNTVFSVWYMYIFSMETIAKKKTNKVVNIYYFWLTSNIQTDTIMISYSRTYWISLRRLLIKALAKQEEIVQGAQWTMLILHLHILVNKNVSSVGDQNYYEILICLSHIQSLAL